MKTPSLLQFSIHKAKEGGYYAEAIGYSIYTQGETIDETVRNINDAVECHFEDELASRGATHVPFPILANMEISEVA